MALGSGGNSPLEERELPTLSKCSDNPLTLNMQNTARGAEMTNRKAKESEDSDKTLS